MQEKKHTKLPLYQRVRKMLLSGILLALLLSLGASFALNMIQESRTRERRCPAQCKWRPTAQF